MNSSADTLTTKHCKACEGVVPPLDDKEVEHLLKELSGWTRLGKELIKTYHFKNYFETIAFVNATAWVSHHENHHPDLEVGYQLSLIHI